MTLFSVFPHKIVSPQDLVTIQPSELIAEHNSEVSMTCGTTAGPSNSFFWFYNVSGIVCGDDCIGTTENFNAFLSGKSYCT